MYKYESEKKVIKKKFLMNFDPIKVINRSKFIKDGWRVHTIRGKTVGEDFEFYVIYEKETILIELKK